MIEYLKYRLVLTKLFRQKVKLRATFKEDILRARKQGKSRDDIMSLESQAWFEEQMVNEEISIIVTDYLIRRAKQHFMPIPSRDETSMWEQCNKISNRYVLTDTGIFKLRSDMRLEQKERIDVLLTLLAAFTGIVGALTGLAAVLLK